MQPGKRVEEGVLLRREMHLSGFVHIDIVFVQGQAEEREEVIDPGGVIVKGELQGEFILQAVAVRIALPEAAEHLRQLLHRFRNGQVQAVQPGLVDKKVTVGVDTLGDQEAKLVDMSVGCGKLFPEAGLVHAGGIVGKETFLNVFVQRNQQVAGYPVFLHIQGAAQDHVRHLPFRKSQAYGTAPLGVLDFPEINMNAGLLLNLLKIPHAAEIHGNILDFILQGGQRRAGSGGFPVLRRRRAACQQQ